ncbi:hypothetical protein IFT48_02805 [Pseudomonas fluorescens]|uniref:hypothetical protein n=1 Tax=Pseudomonas TaxID=286 RepID=UPI000F0331B7|nr:MULTISPECIES: hypothetical protein [Pseudomonas]MBD8088896.1 hypothetical protein [Pseudomonas fluorescens]
MKKLLPFAGLCLLAFMPSSEAGIRLQHYVPELKGMAKPVSDPAEKLDAFIFTPNGLTCNLPSRDGYCRVPMLWMTTKSQQVSLWRQDGDQNIRVAYAYDGQNDAYLTLGKSLTYRLHDGPAASQRLLDSVNLTALWDDAWVSNPPPAGELTAANSGACDLYSGEPSCDVILNWSARNVPSASVWQRTSSGLTPLIKNVKAGSVTGYGYEFPAIYELREGGESTGTLLSSVMTQGKRPVSAGTLSLPDGDTCLAMGKNTTCQLRVQWNTNDISRLWIRDKPYSNARLSGQSMVTIAPGSSIVDLRASSSGAGKILDRKSIKAVQSDYSASFNLVDPTACTILYSKDTCTQSIYFKTDAPTSTVWDENGQAVSTNKEGTFPSSATEYGVAYTLREGNDFSNPPLASFISQGIKQTFTGSLVTNGPTQCTFNYQRGTCSLKLDYTATDGASIWNSQTSNLEGGGSTGGVVTVGVSNYDGAAQTKNTFDLRFHGAQTPQLSNPWLDTKELTGVRPAHTGSLKASATTCNMIYSRNDCGLSVTPTSTSPLVTLWRDDNGQKIWSGAPGSLVSLLIPTGTWNYSLREGDDVRNDALAAVTLTANRPTYFQRLTAPTGECTNSIYNGTCSVTVNSAGNTSARIWYKASTSSSLIASATGSTSFTASLPLSANKRQDQTWDVQVRMGASVSGELLDEMQVVAHPNAPHTFKLVQSITGSPEAGFCQAYESSDSCVGIWAPKWESSAATVTACLYDKATGALKASKVTTDKTFSVNVTHPKASRFEQRFYEGNTVCGTDEALLKVVDLPWVKVIDADKYPFSFENPTYSCEIYYTGIGSCSLTAAIITDSVPSGQTTYPVVYLKYTNGGTNSGVFSLSAARTNYTVVAKEGIKDQVVELRVRKGGVIAEDDPVLDTMVLNHTNANVVGNAFAATTRPPSSVYYNTSYVDGAISNTVYLKRLANGDKWAAPEPCLVNAESTACTLYFWLNSGPTGSSVVSLFIDGVYKTRSNSNSTTTGYSLSLGDHSIELREGSGEESKANKLLDGYTLKVKRPDSSYFGSMTLPSPIPSPTFYNNTTQFDFAFTANSSGYVYNRNTGALICINTSPVAPSESATVSRSCAIDLREGNYIFDLYSERTTSSPTNVLMDSKSFTIARRQNGAEITPSPSYASTYDTCKLPFNQNYDSCRLFFMQKLQNGDLNKTSAMACAYDADKQLTGQTALPYQSASTLSSILVKRGSIAVMVIDGAACPATVISDPSLILASWPVRLAETVPNGTIDITGAQVQATSGNQYTCTRRYFNDTCAFNVNYETFPKADAGASYLPTNTVLYRNSVLLGVSTLSSESYTVSSTLAVSEKQHAFQSVACKISSSKSTANCPVTAETLMGSVSIQEKVPDYTGTIELPAGDFCEAQYSATDCPLAINVSSDSGYVSLYRDGVRVGVGAVNTIAKSLALPVKADGIKTKLSLYDGTNNSDGRLLKEVEVWAKQQDPNEFRFGRIIAEGYSQTNDSICYISSLIVGETSRNCEFQMTYSGDASRKSIKANTPSKDSLEQTTVSGSGTLTGSHVASRIIDSSQRHLSGLGGTTLRADREGQTFYLHVSEAIKHGQTAFGGLYATKPTGQGFTPGFSIGSYSRLQQCSGLYNQNCTYYDSGSNYLNVYSAPMAIDGISLSAPTYCGGSNTSGYNCGRIPFNTLSATIPQSGQRVFGFKTDAEALTRKVFYRVTGFTESQKVQLIDPSISTVGISRTLNLDGQWHVMDMTNNRLAGGSEVLFTFTNQGAAATASVAFFLETEPKP